MTDKFTEWRSTALMPLLQEHYIYFFKIKYEKGFIEIIVDKFFSDSSIAFVQLVF